MRRRNILAGCVVIFVACACVGVAIQLAAPIAVPVATTLPAATDEPTGGLGATRDWWEREYGRMGKDVIGDVFAGGYTVAFDDDRAWYVELQSETGADLATLIPTDSVLVDTYPIADGDRTARVYTSAWLAGQFGDDQWGGEYPGTFTVTINASEPVTRIVIATGENP